MFIFLVHKPTLMRSLLSSINCRHHVTVMARKKEDKTLSLSLLLQKKDALIADTMFALLICHLAEACTDSWRLSVSGVRCMLSIQFSLRVLQAAKSGVSKLGSTEIRMLKKQQKKTGKNPDHNP